MRMNWFNYLFLPTDGYGRLGLKTVQALIRAGHDVRPYTIDAVKQPGWFQRAQGIDFSHASVMLMPPHEMRNLPGRVIGYSMHESETLPEHWAAHVNDKCQWLIVPSQWMANVMADNGVKVPLAVVPGAIDPEECQIVAPHRNRPFTFGALADRANRKGYDKVWTAFYKAFDHRNRDVRLLIKCRPGSLPMLDFSYSSDDRMTIWRADIDNIADIYAQMDAYIIPARAEGLGMTQREAAGCGLPVVALRYSGAADDIDQWGIPLERFTRVESEMRGSGGVWAEPDLDEIVEKMRWLYDHQDEARAKGLQAAAWLRANRTYVHAADAVIRTMNRWLGGPIPEPVPSAKPLLTLAQPNGREERNA